MVDEEVMDLVWKELKCFLVVFFVVSDLLVKVSEVVRKVGS